MTKYICCNNKPLYPQPDDYTITYNQNGQVLMSDGTVCSDLNAMNATVEDITEDFPVDYEAGLYFYNDGVFTKDE
jgi:hypothetical protein